MSLAVGEPRLTFNPKGLFVSGETAMTKRSAEDWVRMAAAKELVGKRARLMELYTEEGVTVATDGFRLHAVDKGSDYIDFRSAVKDAAQQEGKAVMINPDLLRDTLPESGECKPGVVIRVIGPGEPVEIGWVDTEGNHRYAMFMPMQDGGNPNVKADIPWRPIDGGNDAAK